MSVQETTSPPSTLAPSAVTPIPVAPVPASPVAVTPAARPRQRGLRRQAWRGARLGAALLLALLLLGGSAVPAAIQVWRGLDGVVQGLGWDLIGWEVTNVRQKLSAEFAQPIRNLDADARAALVHSYLARARAIAQAEAEVGTLYTDTATPADIRRREQLQGSLKVLRSQQAQVRHAVEQVLEAQVGQVLAAHGLRVGDTPFPPVFFTFSEPPRKLVVSPRDRIETSYYAMLQPDLPPEERERIEETILADHNQSALVTNIGGLGAYPTLVVDRAPLDWVVSTVAHEWTHNYLTLFPLGINYTKNTELMILNETVAEIVGNELGAQVMRTFYPQLVFDFPGKDEPAPTPGAARQPSTTFDFNKEMRHTREVVDLFLRYGRVQDAEEYMEIRRLLFQENGYNIRKLNQAYFAFHGSYGTGAAATSPIGPKLETLRAALPDLRTFLETVRGFTSEADLDAALAAVHQPS